MLKGKKNPSVRRSKYVDHSLQFLKWVERVGLERTWLKRLGHTLFFRFQLRQVVLIFLFSLFLSVLLFTDFNLNFTAHVGDVARVDIVSPMSVDLVDEVATRDRRMQAAADVPPVFNYDLDIYEKIAGNVNDAFRDMRAAGRNYGWIFRRLNGEKQAPQIAELRAHFEKQLGVKVPEHLWTWLVDRKFSPQIENAIIRILDTWSESRIAESPNRVIPAQQQQVTVRTFEDGGRGEELLLSRSEVRDLGRRSDFENEASKIITDLPRIYQKNILRIANLLLVPNMTLDVHETNLRKAKAAQLVGPVKLSVKKNQVLVQEGTAIQRDQLEILRKIHKMQSRGHIDLISLLCGTLFTFLILVFFSYLRRFTLNRVKVDPSDIYVMAVVTLIVVVLVKGALFFTGAAFASSFEKVVPQEALLYVAPVAAGPMLVGLLISSGEVVWLFTIFLAAALAIMVDQQFSFMLVSIGGGIAAARGVFACKKRNDIYWAGVRAGLVNAVIIALILAISRDNAHLANRLLWATPAGFISGILSALVAMMLIPLLESVFNYTTDVKLLELSNLNHPLLKEMIVKAPGTYHHSLVVGSMVEAAAEEIGANSLLAKVMAYYHDIGKMSHAAYFIENQKPGYNPHDNLSPHMSKTILVAHVKDGADLGLRYKLGKPIIDGILQHHGTTLISYFYNKAMEMNNESLESVSEADFRYPGPKPQFREAALCMLADSIEAAARSLDEPTPSRLQNIVKNIIQRKFMDGQLEECNLTLRDLSVIEDSFNRVLLGIYHQRIDYPRKAGGGAAEPEPILLKPHSRRNHTTA